MTPHQRDLYHLVRKNSIYVLLGKVVMPAVNLLVTVYIIRRLSVVDFGTLNVLFAIMSFVGLFSSFGVTSVFSRYIPEFYEQNEPRKIRRLVMQGILLRFLLIVVVITVLLTFSAFFGVLFKMPADNAQLLKLFSIVMIFYLESMTMAVVLESMFLHKYLVLANIVYTILRAALMFIFVGLHLGLTGIIYAELFSAVIWFLLYMLVYLRFSLAGRESVASPFPYKRIARFGAFSFLSQTGAEVLGTSIDNLLIAAFSNPVAVGLYAFSNKLATMVAGVMPDRLLDGVIAPLIITKHTRSQDTAVLAGTFTFITKLLAFIYLPATTGLILLGDKITTFLFSAKYLKAVPVLWVVAGFALFSFYQTPLIAVLNALEKVEFNFYSKLFAIYNLVMALVLIRPFGIMGVAFATGSAVLLKNLYLYWLMRRFAPLRFDWRAMSKFALNSLAMGILVALLRTVVTGLVSLILVIAAGALVYILAAFFNKGFNEEEHQIVNKLLTKPIFNF